MQLSSPASPITQTAASSLEDNSDRASEEAVRDKGSSEGSKSSGQRPTVAQSTTDDMGNYLTHSHHPIIALHRILSIESRQPSCELASVVEKS